MSEKMVTIRYFASLREQRGISEEKIHTQVESAKDLYLSLQKEHGFSLSVDQLRVASNSAYVGMDVPLVDGDVLTFIPPVAGG